MQLFRVSHTGIDLPVILVLKAILVFIACTTDVFAVQSCNQTYGIEAFNNEQQRVTLSLEHHQTYVTFHLNHQSEQPRQFRFPVCIAPRLIVTTSRSFHLNQAMIRAAIPEVTEVERLWVTPDSDIWLIHFTAAVAMQRRLPAKIKHLNHTTGVIAVQPDILIEAHPALGEETNRQNRLIESFIPELPAIWQRTTGQGIKIAVIDDGFDLQHRDFAGLRTEPVPQDNPAPAPAQRSPSRAASLHGTSVAGIIFARHNHLDINGIAPGSTLIPVTITGSYTSSLLHILHRAFRHQPDIINISWYLPWLMHPVKTAIHDMAEHGRQGKGTAIIVASGNRAMQGSAPYSLAGMNEVLTVGAYHVKRHKPSRARGSYIDLAAPAGFMSLFSGTGTMATDTRLTMRVFNGSSAATPYISGLSALFLSVCPQLHRKQLYRLLKNNTDTPPESLRPFMGAGLINTGQAWHALRLQCLPETSQRQREPRTTSNTGVLNQ